MAPIRKKKVDDECQKTKRRVENLNEKMLQIYDAEKSNFQFFRISSEVLENRNF